MAKILRKLPKRTHGKYANTGAMAEEVLLNIQEASKLIEIAEQNIDLTDSDRQKITNYLHGLSLISCADVSYHNSNGLNTFQNAEKTGFTQDLNDEQIKILKKISHNIEMARILVATGKYSAYIMVVLTLCSLYLESNIRFLYDMIQPGEIYTFIGFALCAMFCILKQESLANKTAKQIKHLVNQNTL